MSDVIHIAQRRFGIHEYGDKNGFPVFYFHGFPGSRLDGDALNFNEQTVNSNFRIIAIDRPGIGLSDYQPKRTLLDWGSDIASIADILHINSFSVLGFSGGAPYALACAFKIPHRVSSVGFVSGMGPIDYNESKKDHAMIIPRQIRLIRKFIATSLYKNILNRPGRISKGMRIILPKADVEYFSKGNVNNISLFFSENFKQGPKGFLEEAEICRRPWGFRLSAIHTRVHVWQGVDDRNVSIRSAKRIAQELPDCHLHIIENEGHFSLIGKRLNSILQELLVKTR